MQVVSDLHLDVNITTDVSQLVIPRAKYLAILGDTGFRNIHRSIEFIKYRSNMYLLYSGTMISTLKGSTWMRAPHL